MEKTLENRARLAVDCLCLGCADSNGEHRQFELIDDLQKHYTANFNFSGCLGCELMMCHFYRLGPIIFNE